MLRDSVERLEWLNDSTTRSLVVYTFTEQTERDGNFIR